jgi:hypothetical protein
MTGLILWALLLELWGVSCPDDSFFGEPACNYTARCKISKKDMEAARAGQPIDLQNLQEKDTAIYE